MGINTLFDLRAFFQRTKVSRFTSSPHTHTHTHTQKDRWGLPSSSMLLSTWGFTQNGGGRLEKTSHHLTLASTFKCTCSCSFRSKQPGVCVLHRQACVQKSRSIADKHAKLWCTALPRAPAS